MKLFDCTLRDGANVVGNGFSEELTQSITKNLLRCGIKDIELGNAKGLGAYKKLNAIAPLDDLAYMQLIFPYAKLGNIGMFALAECVTEDNVQMAADNGLRFLRVGSDAGDGEKALDAIKTVKSAGLTCRYSLMKAYLSSPQELAEEAALLEDTGVDIITIMDSAGAMHPSTVESYVKAMKDRICIPVGFHGHNNLGLSQANALAAMASGADEIDCSLLGMARSVGNCSTELTIATMLHDDQLGSIDFYGLLDYLDSELIPAMQAYDYCPPISPLALILGLSGCHSSFLDAFQRIAEEENVSLYQLIIAVSLIDRKRPGEEHIRSIAKKLN